MAGTDIVSAGRQWTRVVQRSPPEVMSSRHQEKGDHAASASGAQMSSRRVIIGKARSKEEASFDQAKTD